MTALLFFRPASELTCGISKFEASFPNGRGAASSVPSVLTTFLGRPRFRFPASGTRVDSRAAKQSAGELKENALAIQLTYMLLMNYYLLFHQDPQNETGCCETCRCDVLIQLTRIRWACCCCQSMFSPVFLPSESESK